MYCWKCRGQVKPKAKRCSCGSVAFYHGPRMGHGLASLEPQSDDTEILGLAGMVRDINGITADRHPHNFASARRSTHGPGRSE